MYQIRSEKRTTTSEVIVRGKRNKENRNWLYFNFSVESASFIFNNFKTEKSKVTFKGWHGPVCHLFGFTRVSACKNSVAFHPRTVKRILTALMPSLLFRCFVSFSASFNNSSLSAKYNTLPTLTMAARAKNKNSGLSVHYRDLEHANVRILNLIAWLC